MSERKVVVQGAICKCQFGIVPDKLKVLSHQKEYANDKDGQKKLIGTTKEIGPMTFEMNSFGSCTKMGSPPPPCKVMVTEWQNFYEDIELTNGGNILVEDSKAVCAVAGTPCIEVIHHGQIAEPCARNFEELKIEVLGQINPMIDLRNMDKPEREHNGLMFE